MALGEASSLTPEQTLALSIDDLHVLCTVVNAIPIDGDAFAGDAWADINLATHDGADVKSVTTETIQPQGVTFSSDGLIMYVIGNNSPATIYQYTLSTAWQVSSASYASKTLAVTAPQSGIIISPDGTKVLYTRSNLVVQLTLSTAFDITSGTETDTYSTGLSGMKDIDISSDGETFWVSDTGTDDVHQFDMSTGWDLTTASNPSVNFALTVPVNPFATGFHMQANGLAFYTGDITGGGVHQFDMSTAFDITTAVYLGKRAFVVGGNHWGVTFSPDGRNYYAVNDTSDTVYQYELPAP